MRPKPLTFHRLWMLMILIYNTAWMPGCGKSNRPDTLTTDSRVQILNPDHRPDLIAEDTIVHVFRKNSAGKYVEVNGIAHKGDYITRDPLTIAGGAAKTF